MCPFPRFLKTGCVGPFPRPLVISFVWAIPLVLGKGCIRPFTRLPEIGCVRPFTRLSLTPFCLNFWNREKAFPSDDINSREEETFPINLKGVELRK